MILMSKPFDAERTLQEMQYLWNGKVPHEEDFLFFRQLCGSNRLVTLLDCGANAGQSAISFLMSCPKGRVISYEPNLIYQPVLEGVRSLLGAERFEFHMEGLSDEESDLNLYIPYVDGIPYMEEATIDLTQFDKPWIADRLKSYGNSLEIFPIRAHFSVADSNSGLNPDVIKIDAEGAEMRVLRGMKEMILRCRPIFLIENNDWHTVTDLLGALGYTPYQWQSGVGRLAKMSGASTNCFYLLKEHFDICMTIPGDR
jgi:FkbM family methyltransferase